MEDNFKSIVDSLFSILPLFKKKLIKPPDGEEDTDLSPSHYQVLFVIEDLGMMPISQIAKTLYISKSNMTPLIRKLIKKGFVERLRDKNDRRYVNIALTEQGQQFIEEHRSLIAENLNDKLTNLSQEDLQELARSLASVKKIFSKID